MRQLVDVIRCCINRTDLTPRTWRVRADAVEWMLTKQVKNTAGFGSLQMKREKKSLWGSIIITLFCISEELEQEQEQLNRATT